MKLYCQDCGDLVADESGQAIEFDQRLTRCCSPCEDDRLHAAQKGTTPVPWDIDFDVPAGSQHRQ
jgi:hypothetical protein